MMVGVCVDEEVTVAVCVGDAEAVCAGVGVVAVVDGIGSRDGDSAAGGVGGQGSGGAGAPNGTTETATGPPTSTGTIRT